MKFYKCDRCGQVIAKAIDTGLPVICCGQEMKYLEPRSNDDLANEKHVPTYEIKDNKVFVKVGSVNHPMEENHYINWIFIQTNKGNQRKVLNPGDEPCASFCLDKDEKLIAIYAYCNLHSLWKKEVND